MANLAAQADTGKDSYDEIEIDLASGGGHGAPAGSGYVDDTTPIGTGSARRLLPRGERCSRCFRRRMVRVAFRLINLAVAFLFLASAALQYNDSAGFLWAAIYFAAAVFCILSELSWRQLRAYLVLPLLWLFTASTTVGAAYVLIGRMLVRRPRGGLSGEDAFDFYGLVLVSLWMSIVLMLDRYNVVGVFRGYTSLSGEHERDKEGHVQMGEVVI